MRLIDQANEITAGPDLANNWGIAIFHYRIELKSLCSIRSHKTRDNGHEIIVLHLDMVDIKYNHWRHLVDNFRVIVKIPV